MTGNPGFWDAELDISTLSGYDAPGYEDIWTLNPTSCLAKDGNSRETNSNTNHGITVQRIIIHELQECHLVSGC
ncbi:uncharacterized protein Bfra_005843 [Botrytis fragariae]|uniref:Uncharacterized protein n=1 Tax=Botrytis fragariae TaxID=1964551 RepID=A0A8H6ARV2_9HELO|nr:uncharacterized protein Bfra_005843 [Botrytis fragariae]KAF5872482.1 hypothetical protein Bfra_005843 [Botrytis fragariae]